VRAVASALLDGNTDHVLLAHDADARLAPASLTKMMTALVAVERAPLSTPIVATERSMSEPAVIGLEPGDQLPLEEMFYGLLLSSGNDAALAIAETVGGGSIDQFVASMNDRVTAMGLKNTHFSNPTGLDAPNHYSSARDVAEMARALLADPTLARIVATPRYVAPGPPPYLFVSINPLVGSYDGIDGVKTGFTDDAGRTFAASATRNGQRLIAVVMNSPDIGGEARQLLDLGFNQIAPVSMMIESRGLAALREGNGSPALRLAGWERPFLRGFTWRQQDVLRSMLLLERRPLIQWTE
jgi:D-alanyl-D-alanine carboxypeptidase